MQKSTRDPFRRKPVNMRCKNFSLGVVDLHVTVADVVGQDDDEIGLGGDLNGNGGGAKRSNAQQQ